MDLFKTQNVNMITANDINAKRYVKLGNNYKKVVKHQANKQARHRLKDLLIRELKE